MGFLITVEAPDASGKATQTKMLLDRLTAEGYKTYKFAFPNYGSDACKPVEMYLDGVLGNRPEDTNAYSASVLFAVDRFCSFRSEWKEFYDRDDYVILLNRYTTANAVHQLSKIDDQQEKEKFLSWLFDFEYGLMKIPAPDLVIYLEMPTEISMALLEKRCDDTGAAKDIHEEDKNHLTKSRNAAIFACEKLGWHRVSCAKDGQPRTREDIHNEIFGIFSDNAPKILAE